ncbi:MAG: hypothetical protein JOZ16_18555 [Methylobacteriaceae bacterium]|nr:hypothetical protein [Methylobacteriaceae bacterium]
MDDADRAAPRALLHDPNAAKHSGVQPGTELKSALRRARIENAERSDVIAELRGAEVARLEILQEQLAPVLAQVPVDCDLFDVALVPSEHPRLFIDMIGFVEMGRDRRLYRFLQDTRHGRITLCESEQTDTTVDAVTNYIAQRLIEREQALAADARAIPREDTSRAAIDEPAPLPPARKRPQRRFIVKLFVFLVDLLGVALFFALIVAASWYTYKLQASRLRCS